MHQGSIESITLGQQPRILRFDKLGRQLPRDNTSSEAAIKQYFAEHEEYGDNLAEAAADYFETNIRPTLLQTAETKVLGDLKTKAVAGTVSPGVQVATQKPKFKTHGDAMRYYAEHPAEAEAMANSR